MGNLRVTTGLGFRVGDLIASSGQKTKSTNI